MSDINKVVVVGAGTMGAGIAGICAAAGCDVALLDLQTDTAQAGIDSVSLCSFAQAFMESTCIPRFSSEYKL